MKTIKNDFIYHRAKNTILLWTQTDTTMDKVYTKLWERRHTWQWGQKGQVVNLGLPITVRLAMERIPLASALIWQISSSVTSLISSACFFPSTWMTTVLLGWILLSFLYQVMGMFSWESSSSKRAVLPSFTVWSFIGEINFSLIPNKTRSYELAHMMVG